MTKTKYNSIWNRKKMMHRYLLVVIISALTINLYAQVTVGADLEPAGGTILNLKENNNTNENSSAGLLLPRVKLEVRNELYPMFEPTDPLYTDNEKVIHTGLTVYNLTTDAYEDLCPGPYVWNGNSWKRLWEACSFFDFLCQTMQFSELTKQEKIPFNVVNSINYNSSIEVDIAANEVIPYGNGLSIVVLKQEIKERENGQFTFYVCGDNTTTPGTYELPLSNLSSILGIAIPGSCIVTVNITATPAPPITLRCGEVHVAGYLNVGMQTTPATSTAEIPYTLSGGSYVLQAGNIGTHEGVTAYVETQTLASPSGNITVKFTGTPTKTVKDYSFSIEVAGSTCSIYLSIIKPPADCPDGTSARAFVFQQGSKWYVVAIGKLTQEGYGVAQTIECNSEEEALIHPDALQYCGTQTTGRCIKLYNREGVHVGSVYMSTRSAGWLGGIAEGNMGCQQSIEAYSGSRIKVISYATGYLGATKVTNGKGYLGITTETATLTTKGLR